MKTIRLTASHTHGEGSILVSDDFNDCPPMLRYDLLSDWINLLENEYQKARADLFGKQNE